MKIKAIQMKNFRGFRDKTVRFSEGFNVLVGDNGTGKTTILDAVRILVSYFINGLDKFPIKESEKKDVLIEPTKIGEEILPRPVYPLSIKCFTDLTYHSIRDREKEGVWTHLYNPDNNQGKLFREPQVWRFSDEPDATTKGLRKAVLAGEDVDLPLICYYGIRRFITKNLSSSSSDGVFRFEGYSNCLDVNTDERRFLAWFKKVLLQAHVRGKEIKVLEGVRNSISTVIPECKMIGLDENAEDLQATIYNNGKEQVLPFKMLSDGYRNMLAMVADIAYRCAVLNPQLGEKAPLETHGMVLIDEIDLHLHPKWQRSIVGNLKKAFPNIQFVVTTHSPIIIQSLQPGELINLNDYDPAEYYKRSVEDVMEDIQGIENPQRSEKFQKMIDVAKEYYTILKEADNGSKKKVEELKKKLDELSEPFIDDPAYVAYLEMERVAAGLGKSKRGEHATSK